MNKDNAKHDCKCGKPRSAKTSDDERAKSLHTDELEEEEELSAGEEEDMSDKSAVKVPAELREVLLEFSIAFLIENPPDVVDYAVEYFCKLQETRRLERGPRSPDAESPNGSIMSDDEQMHRLSTRRKSVFAEAYDPENDDNEDEGAAAVFPKTDEQRNRLIDSVKNVLLFRSLEKEQMNQVLDAMFEKRVEPFEYIIRQGDDGDNFYVIESGIYKVIVSGKHVHTYHHSGIFGELALLYNMPRAATVQAETEGRLWAMDRQTFRRILLKSAFKKRKMYESLLDSVPMLKALQNYERMNLADALVTKRFTKGQQIIKQGDAADGMYFIEEGRVSIKMEQDGEEIEIQQLGKGQYFGELALVTHRPRAASVYAEGGDCKVAFLDTEAFERILGFLTDVLKRNVQMYEKTLETIGRESWHN